MRFNPIVSMVIVAMFFALPVSYSFAAKHETDKSFVSRVIQVGDKPVTGPIAPGVIVDDLIFVSGQVPLDFKTGKMAKTIEEQTVQALENVKNVLEAAGSNMEDVVKVTILLDNLDNYDTVNKIYATYFTRNFPARICYEVSRLPLDSMIEIEAIAIKR